MDADGYAKVSGALHFLVAGCVRLVVCVSGWVGWGGIAQLEVLGTALQCAHGVVCCGVLMPPPPPPPPPQCNAVLLSQLVDFGFAKRVPGSGRTYTLCGTPDYMSPELVMGRGYGRGADYWALGVLVYEMITGVTPFGVGRQRGDSQHSATSLASSGSGDGGARVRDGRGGEEGEGEEGGEGPHDGTAGAPDDQGHEDVEEADPSLAICKNVISKSVRFPTAVRQVRRVAGQLLLGLGWCYVTSCAVPKRKSILCDVEHVYCVCVRAHTPLICVCDSCWCWLLPGVVRTRGAVACDPRTRACGTLVDW